MAPTDQGLDIDNSTGSGVDDRLVVHHELTERDRLGKVGLHRTLGANIALHAGLEETDAIPTFGLGAIERQIRVLHQGLDIGSVPRRARDADARADRHEKAVDLERRANAREYALSQTSRRLAIFLRSPVQNSEFVAADTGDEIALADGRAQSRRHRPQQRVAKGMTAGVVDGFEFIEIEQQYIQASSVGPLAGQQALHLSQQQHAIGRPGQLVVQRQLLDLVLGVLTRGHILMHGQPAAVAHRPGKDENDPAVHQPIQYILGIGGRDRRQAGFDVSFWTFDEHAFRHAFGQYFFQRGARLHVPPREIVNFAIPVVGDEESLVAAEPGDSLRNVAEQQLEARVQRLHVPALFQQQGLRAAQTINMVESRLQQEDGAQERQEGAEADLQGPHAPGREDRLVGFGDRDDQGIAVDWMNDDETRLAIEAWRLKNPTARGDAAIPGRIRRHSVGRSIR